MRRSGLALAGLPDRWQMLVVAGDREAARCRDAVRDRARVRVVGYLDDPRAAYAAADIVVARAGASTLGELAATATPALLVPYPFATADHQTRNALAYAAGGAARIVADAELDAQRLRAECASALEPGANAALRAAARALAERDPRATIVARVKRWIAANEGRPVRLSSAVHFIGIGGIGMSALARILLQRGHCVSGSSDRRSALTDRLVAEGARVTIGHAAANVGAAETVVISTAIASDNPELTLAHARGLVILHRGALLAQLMADRRGIAIAGTHGKTTTTAMVASVLEAGGLDPTVVVGGERIDTDSNARDGEGAWLVSEADESDLSFLDLRPEIAVVTNIENDHIACDAELPRMIAAFERFAATIPTSGCLFVGIDEPRASALAGRPARGAHAHLRIRCAGRRARYGYALRGLRRAFRRARRRRARGRCDARRTRARSTCSTRCRRSRSASNSACPSQRSPRRSARFAAFAGASRSLRSDARMTVVDDYAHHPTAVAATLAAARAAFAGPIVVAFQPHRYTRTHYLAGDFARALRDADRVVLTDVYAASEPPLAGVDAASIGAPLAALGGTVDYVPDVAKLPAHLLATVPPGALVLMLGAGSITVAAHELGRALACAPVAAT